MRSSPKLRPGLWDALVAVAVVLLAVACAMTVWTGGDEAGGLEVVVRLDGEKQPALRLPLEGLAREERIVTANGYTLRLVMTEEEVWVEQSDCPTQDCVHTGHISRSGQSIVCLPARIIVTLEGGSGGEGAVDAVIG